MSDPVLLTTAELKELRGPERVAQLLEGVPAAEQRERLDAAVAKAGREVYGYLRARYGDQTPRTPEATPKDVKDNVAIAALFHLVADNNDRVSEDLTLAYERVRTWCCDVAIFRASIDFTSTTPDAEPTRHPHIAVYSPERRFGNGQLKGMLP